MANIPLTEYPRPQFKRDSYLSLNGYWEYAIRDSDEFPKEYDGNILVPFSPETKISEVNRFVSPHDYLFYRKEISFEDGFIKDYLLLHFTAIDQIADIYFNDELKAHNESGYLPIDIVIDKKEIKKVNEIKVRVKDYSDTSYYARGKQRLNRGGMWYTPTSGIYLPVWVESVSKGYIKHLRVTPDIDNSRVKISVETDSKNVYVEFNDKHYPINSIIPIEIDIKDPILWSPENPYLYEFKIVSEDDVVTSYFAMRKFSTMEDENHIKRLALNNKPYFMKGVLDQGYYLDSCLTPKDYEYYLNDLTLLKELGFNTVRKHIKIEAPYWYYLCDKLGLIVWQDFVNGGETYKYSTIIFPLITKIHHNDHHYHKFSRCNNEGRKLFLQECSRTLSHLYNTPSIGLWTIFNEGWGQFDAKEIYELCSTFDPTRLFDHASGWHDQGISDVKSLHVYFTRVKMPNKKAIKNRAVILSEAGGYNLKVKGHTYNDSNFGYKKLSSSEELEYEKFISKDVINNIPKGLSAFIYTQLSDVEDELNGFITYDRKIVKVSKEVIKGINDKVHY